MTRCLPKPIAGFPARRGAELLPLARAMRESLEKLRAVGVQLCRPFKRVFLAFAVIVLTNGLRFRKRLICGGSILGLCRDSSKVRRYSSCVVRAATKRRRHSSGCNQNAKFRQSFADGPVHTASRFRRNADVGFACMTADIFGKCPRCGQRRLKCSRNAWSSAFRLVPEDALTQRRSASLRHGISSNFISLGWAR